MSKLRNRVNESCAHAITSEWHIFLQKTLTVVGGISSLIVISYLLWKSHLELSRPLDGWEIATVYLFDVSVICLAILSFNYLIARFGFFTRLQRENAAPELFPALPQGKLAIVVPSYCEEPHTLLLTLLGAAMIDHPCRTLTLLIDNPPHPESAERKALLAETRALVVALDSKFREAAAPFEEERSAFEERVKNAGFNMLRERRRLSKLFKRAAGLVGREKQLILRYSPRDRRNVSKFFADCILGRKRRLLFDRGRAVSLRALTIEEARAEYQRLASTFSVSISGFERKKYVNLPHSPSKAMNLNAYLGLLGRSYQSLIMRDGTHLVQCSREGADLTVIDATHVVVIDADSLVHCDYVDQLMAAVVGPENRSVALVQTPYCAIPGSRALIEHVAGATTDLYYPIHQGFALNDSAFWVGPNSLIKRDAIEALRKEESERGFRYASFIRDRTAIEDTDTTVQLLAQGWKLRSHMAQLCFSAAPPDFNALVIQRERWANGGLVVIPDLLRSFWRRKSFKLSLLTELFLRLTSLIAPAFSAIAMLVLIAYPFDDRLVPVWLPLLAIPFYCMLASDLKRFGYKMSELPRVYALNLMLVPVLMGGTLLSFIQIITGTKAKFNRTPRRTATDIAPRGYLVSMYLIFAIAVYWATLSIANYDVAHAVISLAVALAYGYGMANFMEIRPKEGRVRLWSSGTRASSYAVACAALAFAGAALSIQEQQIPIADQPPHQIGDDVRIAADNGPRIGAAPVSAK